METIFDWKYASVHYDHDWLILFITWKRDIDLEEYQRVMIEMLEYGKIHTIESFIADIRKQSAVSPENQKWFIKEILPTAVNECGIKRAAAVHDGSSAQKAYLSNIARQGSNRFGFKLKLTQSEKHGLAWLKRKQNRPNFFPF